MLEQRQLIAALVRELAVQAELIEQHDGAAPLWRLRVERESLRTTALRDKLQAALAEGLGIAPLRLELEAGAVQDTPAKRTAAEEQRRQQRSRADHPQRPAGARHARAVQDRAHRARLDQTALIWPTPEAASPLPLLGAPLADRRSRIRGGCLVPRLRGPTVRFDRSTHS